MGTTDAAWPADAEFVEFVQARQHTLLRGAYLVCADLDLAEDLLEAALVTLARHWDEIREEQPDLEVRRQLYRRAVSSASRRAPDAPRAAGVEATREAPDLPEDDDDAVQPVDVLRALGRLTPLQRAAVVLRHLEERTAGDSARILGVSPTTLTRETDEAVALLRAALPRVDLQTGWTR